MEAKIKVVFATVISGLGFFVGDFDKMLMALLAMIGLDYVTGLCKAMHGKCLSSRVMFWGGIKKVGTLLIVAVANIADKGLGLGSGLRTLAIGYYIASEGVSVLENWGAVGLPLPEKLKEVLQGIAK